jgi:NAD(P)-dependent dehydrogenase (short-subunit alcohol dehydrogenase family)
VRDAIAAAGAEAVAVPTDVSRWEAVEALARRAFEAFGTAHVVCNNAGVACGGLAWEMPEADWSWVLGANLWSVVHGVRAFVPRLIAQGEGHVVNTASMAGLVSPPGMSAYCATKHAVVAISECMHHELAMAGHAGVKVSVLCPAWVKTSIADSDRYRPESAPRRAQGSPPGQMMAEVVRNAVAGGIPPAEVADRVLDAIVRVAIADLAYARFPVLPVERPQAEAGGRPLVKAERVDVPVVRVRPRTVERVNAARAAEHVLRDARVEGVHGQLVLPLQDREALRRDDHVQVAHLGAHRAVALDGDVILDVDAEAHRAAVAASFVAGGHGSWV